METASVRSTPTAFIWRRVHSLTGLWLVIYLLEHLIVNSQAALWLGDDGHGFVRLVNSLESLPYLQVVETLLIGIPLLVHGVWGIKRALTAKSNSRASDGSKPSLPYSRNRAYTWQRLSSWVLLIGIIAHVVQMRFLEYPKKAVFNGHEQSMVKVSFDEGLYTLAPRLHVALYSQQEINQMAEKLISGSCTRSSEEGVYNQTIAKQREAMQAACEQSAYLNVLQSFRLNHKEVVAVAESPGPVMLLSVRDTFKHPLYCIFYTIFVLAAAFHACNGFWTFLIAWGAILSMPAQARMAKVSWVGTLLLSFLGLAAIWGSYWLNLRS